MRFDQTGQQGGSTNRRIVYHVIYMTMGVLPISHLILIHGSKCKGHEYVHGVLIQLDHFHYTNKDCLRM